MFGADEERNADYPAQPLAAVGAVVQRQGQVLLVCRGKPPAKGMWAIPGGKVKLGETLQQAAEREIMEETGIQIKAHEPIYTFEVIERDASGRVRFHYIIVDLMADYVAGEVRVGDDAADARWVSGAEFKSMAAARHTRELLQTLFGF